MFKKITLSDYSYWRIGGVCEFYADVNNLNELLSVLSFCDKSNKKLYVVGNTSNILFDSTYIDSVLVKLGGSFDYIQNPNDGRFVIGGASYMPHVVKSISRRGYVGLEHAIGIPATLGGLIVMNGGSMRKAISEHLLTVDVVDKKGNLFTLDKLECDFSYRSSIFSSGSYIILSATFMLEKGEYVRSNLKNILYSRRSKFPLKYPSCGSVFVSSSTLYEQIGPPGKIIESLNLKGVQIGGARISDKHANFIVNVGGATSDDVLALVSLIKIKAYEKYKVALTPEFKYIK